MVYGVNADINSGAAWTSFANAGLGYIWKNLVMKLLNL